MKYPKVKELRKELNISQSKMAKMLGMSQTGYSKYETGENDIPTKILIKLSKIHNVSVDYILGLENRK